MFFCGDCQGHAIEGALGVMTSDRILEEIVRDYPERIGANFIAAFYVARLNHSAKHSTKQKFFVQGVLKATVINLPTLIMKIFPILMNYLNLS